MLPNRHHPARVLLTPLVLFAAIAIAGFFFHEAFGVPVTAPAFLAGVATGGLLGIVAGRALWRAEGRVRPHVKWSRTRLAAVFAINVLAVALCMSEFPHWVFRQFPGSSELLAAAMFPAVLAGLFSATATVGLFDYRAARASARP